MKVEATTGFDDLKFSEGMQTISASVADNTCRCGWSRKALYNLLQAGRLAPDDELSEFCNTRFMPGWRTDWDPRCLCGTRLSGHPHSQCGEHQRTLVIQMCAVVGLSLMCVAVGVCFSSESEDANNTNSCQCTDIPNATANTTINSTTNAGQAFSRSTSLHLALSASCMTLLAVAVWRHVLDLLRAKCVTWPNSCISVSFALIPLLFSAALCVAAFLSNSNALLSVGCSVSSMYVTELLSTVTYWKRQRHERHFEVLAL